MHFVAFGFNEGRARDTFDNYDYLASYEGLIAAFGPNPQAAAKRYVIFGFGEGRAPHTFDNLR